MPRVLLTSVCRPLGERYGDAPSVGYELLFGQVTRAQGLFSPRANHVQFSLEYVAENLDAPATVLHYPSRRELEKELARGYDVVGISFVLSTFHRMKEAVALVRRHSPTSKIVLGGYGTVLSDEVLRPYADHVCREEGAGFMRRLLGESAVEPPLKHPLVVSRLRLFGREASRTGMVFAGLGCPNGCDFCCTSHFFKRKHIRLLPTGRDIYRVVQRYLEVEPGMSIAILDEDFLLNRARAMEFRDCVREGGRPLSVFAFASVKAVSQYTVTEILEMGIDGLWIGYEGSRSGFAKQSGRPVEELFRELRDHGISVLASMIVGLPYQTPEILEEELTGLLDLNPTLAQFLIYGPTPGTPFFDRVEKEGMFHGEVAADPEAYYRRCTGFHSLVKHPRMSAAEIEAIQERCFREDLRRLGPSIYRSLETWTLGHGTLKGSSSLLLKKKADLFAREIRKAYPVFLAGRLLASGRDVRRRIGELEKRIHRALGPPTLSERLRSGVALALAVWTGLTLRFGLFQHPALTRHTFRMPEESLPGRVWRRLRGSDAAGHRVEVELRPEATVWVSVAGRLSLSGADRLASGLREGLNRRKERLVLDLARLAQAEQDALENLAERLRDYRGRIRVVAPPTREFATLAALFALYH
ncbi:MAG TPA: cobalamin-dependent protein [Thermoanaerobaculia bacterium]|nr:cobalamin-dependent protein [Thermoanaerobaculia bacterium]